jgi:hypothetical protein
MFRLLIQFLQLRYDCLDSDKSRIRTMLTQIQLRLQTQPHTGPRRGLVGMFNHILHAEGAHGLWRGVCS